MRIPRLTDRHSAGGPSRPSPTFFPISTLSHPPETMANGEKAETLFLIWIEINGLRGVGSPKSLIFGAAPVGRHPFNERWIAFPAETVSAYHALQSGGMTAGRRCGLKIARAERRSGPTTLTARCGFPSSERVGNCCRPKIAGLVNCSSLQIAIHDFHHPETGERAPSVRLRSACESRAEAFQKCEARVQRRGNLFAMAHCPSLAVPCCVSGPVARRLLRRARRARVVTGLRIAATNPPRRCALKVRGEMG